MAPARSLATYRALFAVAVKRLPGFSFTVVASEASSGSDGGLPRGRVWPSPRRRASGSDPALGGPRLLQAGGGRSHRASGRANAAALGQETGMIGSGTP